MTVIDTEIGTFRPVLQVFFAFRFHDIEYNSHSILIIRSYNPLISISTISNNRSIPFRRILGRFVLIQHKRRRIDHAQLLLQSFEHFSPRDAARLQETGSE